MDWKEHVKHASLKVSRALGFLKHAKSFISKNSLVNSYKSIVEPQFRYCCSVWGHCSSTEKDHLQNRTTRIITSSNFLVAALPLIKNLLGQTIEELIRFETKIMVFKVLNCLSPQYLNENYQFIIFSISVFNIVNFYTISLLHEKAETFFSHTESKKNASTFSCNGEILQYTNRLFTHFYTGKSLFMLFVLFRNNGQTSSFSLLFNNTIFQIVF